MRHLIQPPAAQSKTQVAVGSHDGRSTVPLPEKKPEQYLIPVSPPQRTSRGKHRDLEALRLRARNYSLKEIADVLNMDGDPARAAAAIRRAAAFATRWAVDEQRLIEMQSLDEAEAILWGQLRKTHRSFTVRGEVVYDENGKPVDDDRFILETMDRIMRVKERRAKMMGLDAPTRSEVITMDNIDNEIKRLEAELSQVRVTPAASPG